MAWPKAVLLAVVLLAAVLLGAGPAQASIKKFTNTDPAWQHVHHHTETLYSWDGQHSRRPAISFSGGAGQGLGGEGVTQLGCRG